MRGNSANRERATGSAMAVHGEGTSSSKHANGLSIKPSSGMMKKSSQNQVKSSGQIGNINPN